MIIDYFGKYEYIVKMCDNKIVNLNRLFSCKSTFCFLPLQMKITTLFTKNATLPGMFESGSPQVNDILHKVYMSVDEVGTVAAAATSAMVIPLIEDGVQLKVDRPFLFFIRDNELGLILFAGKIEEPLVIVDDKVSRGKFVTLYGVLSKNERLTFNVFTLTR